MNAKIPLFLLPLLLAPALEGDTGSLSSPAMAVDHPVGAAMGNGRVEATIQGWWAF